MGAAATEDTPTPQAFTVTLTWSVTVTVVALSRDDATDTARAETSRSDASDDPEVETTDGFNITELIGDDTVLLADLSAAGIEEEDLPHGATEDAWREWAERRDAKMPLKQRVRIARRVLGEDAEPTDGQLARHYDTDTIPMFDGRGSKR